MEDFQQKRRLIEQGQLTSWERRGRGALTVEHVPFHRTLLQAMFRTGWLRARGERNARNAVVKTLRFTFDSLPAAFCGFTLLHLSDIHADGLTGLSESLSRRLHELQSLDAGRIMFRVDQPVLHVFRSFSRQVPCDWRDRLHREALD